MRFSVICISTLLGTMMLLFNFSECLQETVKLKKGFVMTVSTTLPADPCTVCTLSGVNNTQSTCDSTVTVAAEEEVTLLFNCSQPLEKAYDVTVIGSIECTADSCSPTTGEAEPSILTEFSRTFTWNLKAPEQTVLGVDILGVGIKETKDPNSCPDGFEYSLTQSKRNGDVWTKTYCRDGSVTHLDLPSQVAVSLQVKPKIEAPAVVFTVSAKPLSQPVVITTDTGTTVIITGEADGPICNVCENEGSNPTCSSTELTISNPQSSLEFSCPQPQDSFSVQIQKKIECTKTSCSPASGDVQPGLFTEFPRSLTWEVSLPQKMVLSLDIPGDGLKETTGPEKCEDGYKYTMRTTNGEGEVQTNYYCRKGTISHLDLFGKTTVTIQVPQGEEPDSTVFTVKAVPRQGRRMSVMPDPDTRVTISRQGKEPPCEVCVGEEPQQCNPTYLSLNDARNTSLEFDCPRPQDFFSVSIIRDIDCTEIACSGNIVQAESSLFPDFNRTFIWDLKVVSNRAFQMEFPEPGMKQIPNGETCTDEHTYTIVTYLRSGPATIGTFCRSGTISTIQVRYRGRMSLQVPWDRKLDPLDFKLTVGPETNMLAIVKVDLPRGASDTDFMSTNYPRDFPDNEQMRWDFVVPGMHNYTVRFLDHTDPECLSKEVKVEYEKQDKKVTELTLSSPQPEHKQGNFDMSLWNCETNSTLQGLTLKFRVSGMRSGHPVLCTVDLTKRDSLSLQLEKVGSDPYCEMSIDSVVKKNIVVAPGTKAKLAFLDCPNEDLRLTASKTIGCQSLESCAVSGTPLTVPTLDYSLPMPLHSFTWHLNIPLDSTVDLLPPTGSLRQSLPGQECNGSVSLHVAEADGSSIGDFCPKGIIKKIQVHANISVTATAQDFSDTKRPFLNVSFSQEIRESIIYTVNPKMSSPGLLATPNWPNGMKPYSTVSWIVNLQSQYAAELQFVNVSQPKCGQRHTGIKVQTLGSKEEMLSRREDEKLTDDKLPVPESFYLNMSNCMPDEGYFGAVTKITLQKKNNILASILGIVGAVLLLLVIILAAVCIVTKKRKKGKMNTENSIYMGKGNIFRPGDRHFSKTRSDNESHIYTSIDETMVYGHLLRDSSYVDSMSDHFKGIQTDSYQTFTGPTDGELPVIREPEPREKLETDYFLDPADSFIPSRPRTPIPIDRQDSMGFQDRRMVDNELYTFKNIGDINTIRLSAADLEPELEPELEPMADMIIEDSV